MALGLASEGKPSKFDVLGKVPVNFVTKKDVQTNFLEFEEKKLQPLVSQQPAALLRLGFNARDPDWKGYRDWCVTPKLQHLSMKMNGLGHLEEVEKGKEMKLGEFLDKNSSLDKIKDEEVFGVQDLSVLYVNDIHLTDDLVRKGDMWSLFGDLGLGELGEVSGVSTPWGYAGTKGSTFPVHLEDSDLGSINHLMDGKPKIWFVVHPNSRDNFVTGLRKLYSKEFLECRQYHRHKNLYIDPVKVQEVMGIPVYKIVQRPGDMVVTWPGTFHWGYNAGLNASMAVNYCPKGDLAREIITSARQCSPSCKMGSTIFLPVHQLFAKKAFPCKVEGCPSKGYITPQGLVDHMWVEHKTKLKVGDIGAVACPQCGKEVKKLADHLKTHKSVGGSCNLCGEVVGDRKKHWLQGCKTCLFCKNNGISKTFIQRKLALVHFAHV